MSLRVGARREVLAGMSLSLSGAFRLQGEQALNGLGLWVDYVMGEGGLPLGSAGPRLPLRLVVLDDGSKAGRAKENVLRLLTRERVDLLIGPYSSGLTLAVAPIAAAHRKVLWNHGGASDAIFQQGWRYLVSVPSPASDYLRALPLRVKRLDPDATRISILHAKTGSFAAHVARGVAEGARAAGFDLIRLIPFDSPLRDAPALLGEALAADPDLLVGVGSFRDDVAIVRQRALASRVKTLAFVGAGLYRKERKYVLVFALPSFLLFTAGCVFGYFVMIPYGLWGLAQLLDPAEIEPVFSFSPYLSLVLLLTIIMGAIFEVPLVMLFLVKVGLVEPATYTRGRKFAIVAMFVIAAVLTPPDVITQIIMAIPLVLLYELGVILSKLAVRRRAGS